MSPGHSVREPSSARQPPSPSRLRRTRFAAGVSGAQNGRDSNQGWPLDTQELMALALLRVQVRYAARCRSGRLDEVAKRPAKAAWGSLASAGGTMGNDRDDHTSRRVSRRAREPSSTCRPPWLPTSA